jgi:hypothetical protein
VVAQGLDALHQLLHMLARDVEPAASNAVGTGQCSGDMAVQQQSMHAHALGCPQWSMHGRGGKQAAAPLLSCNAGRCLLIAAGRRRRQ